MPEVDPGAAPDSIPEFVSAEDAAQDTHPQQMGDKKRLFGKKRRARFIEAQVAEAIRAIDAHKGTN